jgi:hypothetical protein
MGLISANGVQEVAEKARAELMYILEHTPTLGRGGWPIEKRREW